MYSVPSVRNASPQTSRRGGRRGGIKKANPRYAAAAAAAEAAAATKEERVIQNHGRIGSSRRQRHLLYNTHSSAARAAIPLDPPPHTGCGSENGSTVPHRGAADSWEKYSPAATGR